MDIDFGLYKIIRKYGMYETLPEVIDAYKEAIFADYIAGLLKEFGSEKVVALRCAGRHTLELLERLDEHCKEKISYIIDRDALYNVEGYDVIHPSKICDYKIDTIILSSYNMRAELKLELLTCMKDIDVVDPYDQLQRLGVYYDRDFFLYRSAELYHVTYIDTCTTYGQYVSENKISLKKYYLERLIAQCIEIKDFVTMYRMISEYIENGWDDNDRYRGFEKEVECFFEKIEELLSKREYKDVIINWVDNVNAEEFYGTEFAKKRFEDSYVFLNAYTMTPWTHFTQNTILTGKRPIEEHTYRWEKFTTENSILLKSAYEYGYKFVYNANPGMYQKQFEKEMLIPYPKGYDKVVMGDRCVSECSTRLQWNLLKLRMQLNNPICCLIHNLAETHPPYIFTTVNSVYGDRRKYREQGMRFIAEQLEWYERFYNENVVQIYMADHGDGVEYLRAYEKGRTNIPLIIKGKNIPTKVENGLYSHKYFSNLVSEILSGSVNLESVCKEYVIYENIDFYNKKYIVEHIFDWMHEGGRMDMAHYQCRGIRTEEDLYVKYAIGEELYFRLPDEETNLIDDENYQERIDYLRKMCGDEFININENPVFAESYRLYDYLQTLPHVKW